jgi:hypothetical protein
LGEDTADRRVSIRGADVVATAQACRAIRAHRMNGTLCYVHATLCVRASLSSYPKKGNDDA